MLPTVRPEVLAKVRYQMVMAPRFRPTSEQAETKLLRDLLYFFGR